MSAEVGSDAILGSAGPADAASASKSALGAAFRRLMGLLFNLSAIALVAASAVLTFGVIAAHILGQGVEWQDEMEIFLVSGAVFCSAAAVQARRGHIGIEVFASLLPAQWRDRKTLLTDTAAIHERPEAGDLRGRVVLIPEG